ncbi:hypothetical protein MAPG_10687 [Magnaporthiopsis poae ATCC 64411]|uniref:Uncharacterized protein n=1 Tax=Magnaporthiopsis poae (strain ATCC 64411 / 73-15) TaxID=644358 RepID=A0A0C4ED93_MAGP6|nr:hypothetical protein MAPG_10687 [Magnaporthiopsis poae ATCC 64411]
MNNTTLPFEPRLQALFEEFQSNDTWAGKCVYKIYKAARAGALNAVVASLVGREGAPGIVPNLTSSSWMASDIWGVDVALCNQYCSRQNFPMVFNYQNFLARVTNYLLPWLALTAQLPYEAGDVVPNIMSFFMALGSPMLITFSLMMTILNKRWLNRKCKDFNQQHLRPGTLAGRLEGARNFLEAAQQVPIRISRGDGWLASLILMDDNETWWDRLGAHIRDTRRDWTLSLVVQISVAVAAWILTIIGSFGSSLGSHAEALVLSSSSLWTWLVPIILGWITVGTQGRADGIINALRLDPAHLAGDPHQGTAPTTGFQQSFSVARSGEHNDLDLFGFSVCGDETQPGPAYNYARIFTWRFTAQRLFHYFDTAAQHVDEQHTVDQVWEQNQGGPASQVQGGSAQPLSNALLTLPELLTNAVVPHMEVYCDIPRTAELLEYPTADEVDPELWFHILGAFIMAVFVQWGTTGGAFTIAYLTDAKGLGCRSASYLLYGGLSTLSFLLFVLSALASRAALQRAQDYQTNSAAFQLMRTAAIAGRLGGRTAAVCSAFWIVLSSVWELVGFFDNCWCESTQLDLGERAWVPLFRTAVELKDDAIGPWAGGVFLSSFVMATSYLGFWILSR